MKRYQEFQKKQVQCLLELREAQQRKSLEDLSHKGCPGKEPATTFDSLGPRLQRELERLQAALKQTEAREIEWREKAQDLALSLAQSKASVSDLQEVALFLQASVLERDSEQQRLQVSHSVVVRVRARARSAWAQGLSAPQGVRKLKSRAPPGESMFCAVVGDPDRISYPRSLAS